MNRPVAFAIAAAALLMPASSAVRAQAPGGSVPPTYQADPTVYKVIFENDTFRVIAATWPAGYTDKEHSHPVPGISYALTDCTLKLTNPDGTTRDISNKAGTAGPTPVTVSHHATNVGSTECRVVFVEQKK